MILQTDSLRIGFAAGRTETAVTRGVSIEIGGCEIVALVGESGSGKSVTAMEIAGLNPRNARSQGRIMFGDRELSALSAKSRRALLRKEIGVIFQDPLSALNPVYTVGTSMGMSMKYRIKDAGQRRKRALELLEMVNIPDPAAALGRYPHELSGGQRQRVMIAMAIESEPTLLIADEPTTALDVTVQADILDLIEGLKERLDMSVLLITHDMGVVANSADRMYVMQDGGIVENGPVEEVFSAPRSQYTKELLAAVPRLDARRLERSDARTSHGHGEGMTEPDAGDASQELALAFRGVDYSYENSLRNHGQKALESITFSMAKGSTLGLVGESGSGKSTIGRVAVGLLQATAGTIELGRPKGTQFLRSMVFQDPASSLDPRRSIGESVAAPLLWGRTGTSGRAAMQKARELLERVRLPGSWADRRPHELSGGQRQRVGIARALSIDPDLLIADEPTSALDVSVQAAVLELFAEVQAEYGFACLFISHDLAVVEQVSQRIVVLRNGRIEEQGASDTIMYSPQSAYTRRLIASAPVPDPVVQHRRKLARVG